MEDSGVKTARQYLGCQIWIEPDDSAARIDHLFKQAQACGLGWARLFLMWPWIEREPGNWNFDVYDHAFAAAGQSGILIKATLTANSGPWHIGTPSVLHSQTGFLSPEQRTPMRTYILRCVERYRHHPALGQWILWNEAIGGGERTGEALKHWQTWLAFNYKRDLGNLNRRWRTGYTSFEEVRFPEDIPADVHRTSFWNSYRPWLDDWQARAAWLNGELQWICDIVREADPATETCLNPMPVLSNVALGGLELERMGEIVDVIGGSYHPAWHFTFADRSLYPGLMAAGIKKQSAFASVKKVEVTEVQTGNTLNSAYKPSDVNPGEIAVYFLSTIAAGAASVTGWCLNARSHDFEAGDWGLLDDMDRPSERSLMLRKLHDRLEAALQLTGDWHPAPSDVRVVFDPYSQALEAVELNGLPPVQGRLEDDGAHGASLLAVYAMQCGLNAAMAQLQDVPTNGQGGGLIVLSHIVCWENGHADALLKFVASGGTVLFDATSGRKNRDASLYRPWPGHLAGRIGMRVAQLRTRTEGYELLWHGRHAGRLLLARADVEMDGDAGWRPWDEIRFAADEQPLVWERAYGAGNLIFVNGMLGPSLVHDKSSLLLQKYILSKAGKSLIGEIHPLAGDGPAFVLPVRTDVGTMTAVFAGTRQDRAGKPLKLKAPHGAYRELWTGTTVTADLYGELSLPAEEGIGLLLPDRLR